MNQKEIAEFIRENKNQINVSFNNPIINTYLPSWGVKAATLKKYAREHAQDTDVGLLSRGQNYEEELMLALMLAYKKDDIENRIAEISLFFENIDTWAIVDSVTVALKIKKVERERIKRYVENFCQSPKTFVKRFGYVLLLDYFIDDRYIDFVLSLIQNEEEYYVVMAETWLLAECYIRQKEKTEIFLKTAELSPLLQKKTLQKIRDSRRVTPGDKDLATKIFKAK